LFLDDYNRALAESGGFFCCRSSRALCVTLKHCEAWASVARRV